MVDRPNVDQLNETQSATLAEFREKVKSWEMSQIIRDWIDDYCLCRYLRAREWNLNKSAEMLKATIEWRESFRPHEIKEDEIKDQLRSRSNYVHGTDKNGHPVVYMRNARDLPGSPEEKLKVIVYNLEHTISVMNHEAGVEKMCYIIDLDGFSMIHSARDYKVGTEWVKILQNHYPERCFKIFLIEAPAVFNVFFQMVSPFIDPVTRKKVEFIEGKKKKRRELLLKFFNPEQLEVDYGGELVSILPEK